jgi:para-aminobenzoate synthetase component 1
MTARAVLGGLEATDLVEVTSDLGALDTHGRWAVAIPYAGAPVLARFARWEPWDGLTGPWSGPASHTWTSSMDQETYVNAVVQTREAIAAGTVYQANICRVMSAPLGESSDIIALHAALEAGNPAPYSGCLSLPEQRVHIATASPELFLDVHASAWGRRVSSGPIKGTGRVAADLTDKDRAENVMIVDLVRNDLSQVCQPGTVSVPELLRVEQHPGLVHLVSNVEGTLREGATWKQIIEATFPPGSVTGTPKSTALRLIDDLEPASREFYCGAIGWIDADSGNASLAVAIRTFWHDGHTLKFGTGAGITWGSDAVAEWRETELKAELLVRLASQEAS